MCLVAATMLLLGFVSCTNSLSLQVSDVEEGIPYELTAYLESGLETKTGLVDNGNGGKSVVWRTGDAISLFFNSGSSGGDKFVTTSGGTKAVFKGSISSVIGDLSATGGQAWFWATYPYNTTAFCNGTSITTLLPIVQIASPDDVADNLLVTVGRAENPSIFFKSTCAVIGFKVCHEGITKVAFKGNANEAVAGRFSVSFDENEDMVISPDESSSNYIEITPEGGSTFVAGTMYYFATLPGSFNSGYKLTFERNDGTAATYSRESSFTFARSKFYTMTNKDEGLLFSPYSPDQSKWISFKDAAVKAICIENWDTDGDGELSYGEAAVVKSISTVFRDNTTISSFDEFQYFTGVNTVSDAFYGCSSLSSIILPEGITSMEGAFYFCNSLSSIKLPKSLLSIGECTFYSCSSLTSIEIPSGLTNIGKAAFYACRSLTSLEIPQGVTFIGGWAFYGCNNLTSLVIPPDVTTIGEYTFYHCVNILSIELPSGITSIGAHAFNSCRSLTSFEIPSKVTTIGANAFINCSSLKSIEIPSGLTTINGYSFQNCTSLKSVEIPSGVEKIDVAAFDNCSALTSITVPSGVTSIGQWAFRNCSKISTIIIMPVTPPTAGVDILSGSTCDIKVPSSSVDAYKVTDGWSTYSERIVGM